MALREKAEKQLLRRLQAREVIELIQYKKLTPRKAFKKLFLIPAKKKDLEEIEKIR